MPKETNRQTATGSQSAPNSGSALNPMESAPKDGITIYLETVGGVSGEPMWSGLVNWRTERREGFAGLGFEQPSWDSTGWMRAESRFRVPGRPIGWKPNTLLSD